MTRFAGQIDLTDYMNDFDSGKIASSEMDGDSSNRITAMQNESILSAQGIASQAQAQAAEYSAEAIKAGAQAKAGATVFGAAADGIGSMFGSGVKAYGKANNLGVYGD